MHMDKVESDEVFENFKTLWFTLIILALLLLGGVFYWIIFGVTNSINALQALVTNLSKGNLKTANIILNNDEIGEVYADSIAMQQSLVDMSGVVSAIAEGDVSSRVVIRGDEDLLAHSINKMADNIANINHLNQQQQWLQQSLIELANSIQQVDSVQELATSSITQFCHSLDAKIGAIYFIDTETRESQSFKLLGSYAFTWRKNLSNAYKMGEGLVGQAALEQRSIILQNTPDDYIKIESALGDTPPRNIIVVPMILQNRTLGVIEIGFTDTISENQQKYIERGQAMLAIAFDGIKAKVELATSLKESQSLTEELQAQQEELRASNEELEEQTETIKRSESELKTQQEELQASNEELEEKTQYLEKQKNDIENNNRDIEKSKVLLEEKAKDLEMSSKYKSEFLANMSHELRTPLNSLLILAKMLMDNKEQNLTERQIDSAKIIYNGGNDLLALINDILDLSKVEAGQMNLQIDDVPLSYIETDVRSKFEVLASEQSFEFKVLMDPDLPASFETDRQRTLQIIKNLLSNAFKFTRQGEVVFRAFVPGGDVQFRQPHLNTRNSVGFAVVDTGIGIADEKQRTIFEAFQQADGSTSRDYGGTGLGLTISRDLCALLGGEIQVESQQDRGSTFVVYLPLRNDGKYAERSPLAMNAASFNSAQASTNNQGSASLNYDEPMQPTPPLLQLKTSVQTSPLPSISDGQLIPQYIADDREQITADSTSVLIIEDDRDFASVLSGIAHQKDYLCLAAGDGKSALQLAQKYQPSAILLDLGLPDIDGLKLLDMFKQDLNTRHIPVHVITGREVLGETLTRGAVGFLHKPTTAEELMQVFSTFDSYLTKSDKNILIIEDNDVYRSSLKSMLEHKDVTITEAINGSEGIQLINEREFDCVILDMGLPDMTGSDVLKQLSQNKKKPLPPIIINTGKELTQEEYKELNKYTEDIIVKGTNSTERLLDEVTLFLHQEEASLPTAQRKTLQMLHDDAVALEGHVVLMVDDDLRNTFALSNMLEDKGLEVIVAENGQKALDELDKHPEIELVLMDIMMPVMDGYEAMEKIRAQSKYKDLPIIALTAKAMAEDKTKCLKAGANDYMNKPVDVDKLLSLIKVSIH